MAKPFSQSKFVRFILPRPFPEEEEALYRARQNERALAGVRALLLSVAVGILLFAVWDYFIDPASLPYTLPARALDSALSVILWISTYYGSVRKRLTWVLTIESVGATLTIAWILKNVTDGLLYGLAALSYIPLALLAISDSRFVAVNCLILLTIVNIFALFDQVPHTIFVNANFFLSVMCAFTYAFSRFNEKRDRQVFQLQRELEHLANIDDLTGALNRRRFMEIAQTEVERAQRYGESFALLMMDADHFKRINDAHGHPVGDEALRRFAQTCHNALRHVDSFGRVGGEEFAVLLPATPADGALEIAERLRAQISQLEIPLRATSRLATKNRKVSLVKLTTSIGVAIFRKNDTLETLLERADAALYRAKQQGRDAVVSGEISDEKNDATLAAIADLTTPLIVPATPRNSVS